MTQEKDKLIGTYGRGKAMMEAADILTGRGHKPTVLRWVKAIVELLEDDRKNEAGVYVSDWSSLFDLAEQGAQNGFSGLCYYSETCELYDAHRDAIWQIAYNYCEDNGGKAADVLGRDSGSDEQFKNNAVWFAAEAVAHAVTQSGEGYYVWETDDVQVVMQ